MTPNEVKLDQAALEKAAFYLRVATMAAGSDTSKITPWSELAAAAITAYLSALQATPTSGEQVVGWTFCPECGCEEIRYEEGRHKQCANCGQEWFSDLNYLDVTAKNLRRLFVAPPSPLPDQGDGPREAALEEAISESIKTLDLIIEDGIPIDWRAWRDDLVAALKSTPPQPVAGEPGMEAQTETVKP